MSLDLEKLEHNIDEALERETPESINAWLDEKRRPSRIRRTNMIVNMICLIVMVLCLLTMLYIVIFGNPKYLIIDILFIFWAVLNIPEPLVWLISYYKGE